MIKTCLLGAILDFSAKQLVHLTESDLDAQNLAGVVIKAIDEWFDEEIIRV